MPDQEPQPHSELASFGDELRREREIRGISLKEIADATKISKRFLEALERNDHKTLPAPVFTRGFVREYARYLGLNAEEMVNRYNFAAAGDDRIEQTPHLQGLVQAKTQPAPPPAERPKKGIPPAYARVDRNIYLLIIIVAALVGIAWWAMQHKRAEAEAARRDTAAAATARAQHPAGPAPAPVTQSAVAAVVPPKDELLHLTVELTDDSWLSLDVDGKTVLNDDYRSGMRESYEATSEFRFRSIGNAAGVSLMLDGVQLPPLGGEGKVLKNLVFDRAYVEKLKANTGVTP